MTLVALAIGSYAVYWVGAGYLLPWVIPGPLQLAISAALAIGLIWFIMSIWRDVPESREPK